MSRERAKRAGKVVDLRERATKSCEADLAKAAAATRQAEADERTARDMWTREANTAVSHVCAGDFAERDVRLLQLLRRADALAGGVARAKAEEERARGKLSLARIELKKVETWREGLLTEVANDEAVKESKANDELALRMTGKRE